MNVDNDPLVNLLGKIWSVMAFDAHPKGVNDRVTVSQYPIHIAAIWGDVSAIRILLDSGANINSKGEHGYTPLHEAVEQEHVEVVKLLLESGADQMIKNDRGYTPKELAELLDNQSIIEVFQ